LDTGLELKCAPLPAAPARREMIRNAFARTLVIVVSIAWAGVAHSADVSGVWLHQSGNAKVRFAPCGAGLCGTIVWLRDTAGPWKIGQRVFYDMVADSDNTWRGKAFEASSGREYKGKMTLAGDSLTTAGCAFWGLICKSIVWSRSQ
jgi:uncharacterized protein (DUF2147 family)